MALLGRLLHKRIGWAFATLALGFLNTLTLLWWNSLLSTVINTITERASVSGQMIFTAAVIMLVSAGMAYAMNMCSGWTCETLVHDLRMGYAKHFTTLPVMEIENISSGEQLSKLQNEINDVSVYLRGNLFDIIYDFVRFAATFSWMLWLDPKITLLTNAPVAAIMWYTAYSSKVISSAAKQSQQANAKMNGFTDTLITTFPIVRLFDAAPLIRDKYGAALAEWQKATTIAECKRSSLMSLSGLLSCIPRLLLLLIGGIQVIRGEVTLGTLYIFLNLSQNVSGVMMNMPGRIAALHRFSANMDRLNLSVCI